MRIMMSLVVGLMILAGAVHAKTPLRDVNAIDDSMLKVALALEISAQCGEINARKIKGMSFLYSLKKKANSLGYSNDEINAYRKSDTEKARIRARGEAYVKSKGLNPKSAADLCKLGHAEIKQSSVIGSLLKAK